MSSEIRTNLLKSRAGLSTVTLSDTGPVVTGIATFGVTTKIDGGNNVINVGTALTIGHTQGVQFHTQNLHSTGFEVNQVNASGIITASSYRGDGSQLTGISAGFSPDAQGNLVAGTNAGANFSGTDANHNILIGYEAGNALTTADNNVAIGFEALKSADTEGGNVAIGYRAMKEMTGFGGNVCIGYEAGYYTYGLWDCVAIGKDAMQKPTQSGYTAWSVAVGVEAMAACGASKCVAIGYEALHGNNATSAEDNTAIGYQSLTSVLGNGLKNTAVGSLSGKATTSGDENVYIGYNAGNNAHTTGSNCIIIGSNAAASGASASNEVSIGNTSITKFRIPGLNYVNAAGVVGIGTITPASNMNLHVYDETDRCYVTFESGGNESSQLWLKNPARTWKISNYYDQNALTFTDDSDERLRIKSDGTIAIPAQGSSNSAPRISFESAVDSNHFTFSQYEDSNGTYTLLGQNILLNGSGNTVVSDSGHKTAGIFFDARNHGALTFMTGGTNAYQQSVKIYNNRSISIGNVDNFGQYNSSTQTTSGGSALLVDITNGATSASYTTMVRLRGGASGYVHASLNLCATSDNNSGNYRGLGIYMNDEAANNEWYAGRPYSSSNQYMISYVGTVNAPYAASASTGYAKLMIQPNGNYNFSGSNTSDRDLKENITTLSGTSLDKIIQLTPKTFNFKPQTCETPEGYPSPSPQETPETKTGFIAQEVQSVIPSIVNGTDGKKDMGIDYNGLVAHLVNAIKEQQQQIEILKQDNIALRIRVTNLEDK